jgi:Domain of Unknown Function (DUF326)
MVHIHEMIRTHPRPAATQGLIQCIDTCFDCAQACVACADACLGEATIADLRRCIRYNLDCAAVCQATGEVLSRQTETEWTLVRTLVAACMEACRICAEECERHAAHLEHCAVCADACRRCEQACRQLISQIQ